jgi:hypothetical protein
MKCTYRNCDKEIPTDKRKDSKFCCTSHRKQEQTYIKRKKIFIEEAIKRNTIIVENYKLLEDLVRGTI